MSVRIMNDGHSTKAVLYDSVTDWAFGPVATECENVDCAMDAVAILDDFLDYAKEGDVEDVRVLTDWQLQQVWNSFCRDRHDHEEEQT